MSSTLSRSFDEATATIEPWKRPLLLTHAKPDGDALGAMVAMFSSLQQRGVNPVAIVFDDIPDRYRFLIDATPVQRLGKDVALNDLSTLDLDGVIVLDTCSYGQLEPVAHWLRESPLPKFVVDHHMTRDELADGYLLDNTASAACLILWEWFQHEGVTINPTMAKALYVGIATDTGWFRHSNTDARTLSAATELVRSGVRPFAMYDALFQHESSARFRLRAAVTSKLELLADDAIAVMTLPAALLSETGATLSDTEDLVNEPLRISATVASVFLAEHEGDVIRAGFRSRAPLTDGAPDVDVAAVAKHFGGGGHRRASGARISATLEDARRQVVEHLTSIIEHRKA